MQTDSSSDRLRLTLLQARPDFKRRRTLLLTLGLAAFIGIASLRSFSVFCAQIVHAEQSRALLAAVDRFLHEHFPDLANVSTSEDMHQGNIWIVSVKGGTPDGTEVQLRLKIERVGQDWTLRDIEPVS